MANALSGIEKPKTGGDTLFYNLHLAYENRSLGHRERLKNLCCKHNATRNSAAI